MRQARVRSEEEDGGREVDVFAKAFHSTRRQTCFAR
jgi:hypothetical protein